MPFRLAVDRAMDRLLDRALTAAGPLYSPRLTAWLFRAGIHPVLEQPRARGPGGVRLLLLSKAMFNEDALACFEDRPDVRLYSVHRGLIKAIARQYLPAHIDDNNYANLEAADEQRKRTYRAWWMTVWPRVARRAGFDAVLTGNFAFYAEREMAAALEALGTPFIAIHKECVRSPAYAEFFGRLYRERRGPFTGRRILCYDEAERRLEIETGVAPPERITVTGMPRVDFVHRMRREAAAGAHVPPARPRVLFMAFGPKTTLPVIVRKESVPPYRRYREPLDGELEGLSWSRLHRETHAAMLKLAESTPELDVIVKTKGGIGERGIDAVRSALGVDRLPDNVKVVVGGNPHALMRESAAVCGFNSTSLLEAMAAGKPVVVPRFAEAGEPAMRRYLIDFDDAVEYADSADELVARLRALARRPRPPSAELPVPVARLLDRWLHNADGRAGERVREAVLAETRTAAKAAAGA